MKKKEENAVRLKIILLFKYKPRIYEQSSLSYFLVFDRALTRGINGFF